MTYPKRAAAALAIFALVVTACGSSKNNSSSTSTKTTTSSSSSTKNTASDIGVTPTTITLGYITSLTGVSSSTFADGPQGAQARIAQQNAAGGVDGRKLILDPIDDTSSPAGNLTAAQELVEVKKVFAVIPYTAFTFGSARFLSQQGVPVTGFAFDGPEWAQYRNMFTFEPASDTSIAGKLYNYDYYGKFLQQIGVTKLAGLAYGISASSQDSIHGTFASAANHGIANCYANYAVPFGGVDFTATALSIKNAGCNGVVGSFVDSSDVALSTAIKQAGITAKQLYFTGYDQTTLSTAGNIQAYAGDYFANYVDLDPSLASNASMYSAFGKYIPNYKAGTLPDFGLVGSYIATDLMIKGLEVAGQNPTRKSLIDNLRQTTGYNAGGLLPSPIAFTGFGTAAMVPETACQYFLQLSDGKFVNAAPGGSGPICGNRVAFTP